MLRLLATAFSLLVRYTQAMKIIYVDDMFLLNLVINYFILLATAKLCALPLKRWRFGIAAAVGAVYSVLVLLPHLGFLASPIIKLVLGALMTLISFGDARHLLRPFIGFLAVSAGFGGAVFGASLLAGGSPESGLYINLDLRILILSFAVCYCALGFVFKQLGRRITRETVQVRVVLNGKSAEFLALRDTGNELYEPVSGLPVMVVDIDKLALLLPEGAKEALLLGALELVTTLSENELLRSRMRLVPYSAIGLPSALLPAFRPDKIFINDKERQNLLVGLCPTKLSSDGGFSAVI